VFAYLPMLYGLATGNVGKWTTNLLEICFILHIAHAFYVHKYLLISFSWTPLICGFTFIWKPIVQLSWHWRSPLKTCAVSSVCESCIYKSLPGIILGKRRTSGSQGLLGAKRALYFDCVCKHRPPLWSSGQSSWLQIQRPGFDPWRYQIFWEVVGVGRDPLSLVSTIEELLGRKSSGLGLESREYGHRDPLRWPRGTLYPQKLALTLPTSGGRSVSIVC
jgi:hypothetical protein